MYRRWIEFIIKFENSMIDLKECHAKMIDVYIWWWKNQRHAYDLLGRETSHCTEDVRAQISWVLRFFSPLNLLFWRCSTLQAYYSLEKVSQKTPKIPLTLNKLPLFQAYQIVRFPQLIQKQQKLDFNVDKILLKILINV